MQQSLRSDKSGQSLVEVVIALGVVVILAVSLVTTSLVTQRTSRNAKNHTQATKLVQESIEELRILRDRVGFDYVASFTNAIQCWKLDDSNSDPANWTLASSCPETITLNQTSFSRSLKIENGANSSQKKITVTVTWADTGGNQTVTNVTNLSYLCPSAIVPGAPCPSP